MGHLISKSKFKIPTPLPPANFWKVPNSQSNNVVIQFSHSLMLLEFIANSTILLSNDLTAYQFID